MLGLDIGNENCVIAAVNQRGIDVLLNDESKRETPGVVSFGEKQRFLGATGAACATMNPKSTITQVKRLIGRSFDQPDVQDDLRLLPFETCKGPDGGILIHLQYLGERHTFTPVQILAMLLSHLKLTAEKNLETQTSDCVIGIPSYFTDLQRRLYLDAAAIAGLKTLRLMHDCTATALGYGIYKTDFSKSAPPYVVFVDIGHSDMQVAVVKFEPGHMKVLSHAFDSNLGARDFDQVLFCHFARQFKEQYNIDVDSNTRACIRLRAACEKLKKVLSANPEAPLHIECLMDEKDVKGFIRRDEFEYLSSSILERMAVPCQKALRDAGATLEKIHSVELVGSGSRIPAITRILSSVFRREPRRTLNASECVARGCALQCAMLSPLFRVKEYEVEDSLPFSVGFTLPDEGPIQALPNYALFPKGHPIPSDKVLTLYKSGTFDIEAFYADQNELPPGVSPKISLYKIGPFQSLNTENAKFKVKARLTLDGVVTLASASLVGSHMDETTIRSNAEKPDVEPDNGYTDARNGAEDGYSANQKPVSTAYVNAGNGKVMRRLQIPIDDVVYGGMTAVQFSEAREKEVELTEQDKKVEHAKEKKNTLESYVYESRNKILDTYQEFATECEKDEICNKLQQTEDWLYEDGDDESADVYTERMQDLMKLVDPIENRYRDVEARAQAAKDLHQCILDYQTAAQSLPAGEREEVLTECAKAEQWLQEKMQGQFSRSSNEDPVIWSTDIRRKIDALYEMYRHTRSKSSPVRPDCNAYSDHETKQDDMEVD